MSTRWSAVAAVLAVVFAAAIGAVAVGTQPSRNQPMRPGLDPSVQVERIHRGDVTGAGVDVGVVDVTGFDASHPPIADSVTAVRSFRNAESHAAGVTHGTAAAAVVAAVAPDADLYLASVDDGESFARAVRWMVRREVDVVVAPIAAYGRPDDAPGAFAAAAAWASKRGVVVVAPTGNLGRSHWSSRYRGGGTLRFGEDTRNYLVGSGGRVSLWLSWPRTAASEDYTAELYGTSGGDTWLVARSRRQNRSWPSEHLSASVRPGVEYFVVVRGPDAATGTRLTVTSPTHAFEHSERRGSVTSPAVARRVVAVGAYDPQQKVSVPYSSAGPLADGRRGVDVLGPARVVAEGVPPEFEGTSVAAAYVGGVAALAWDANPGLRASEVRTLVTETAVDAGIDGVDPLAGHGRVSAWRSVVAARESDG